MEGITLKMIRWLVIVIFFCVVANGWLASYSKFTSGRTSISKERASLRRIQYPSVTFCPQFKDLAGLHDKILTKTPPASCFGICGKGDSRFLSCHCHQGCVAGETCCEDFESVCLVGENGEISDNPNVSRAEKEQPEDFGKYVKDKLDLWSFKREDFITEFAHSEEGGYQQNLVHNDSVWKESVPHVQKSGRCFTYDPPFVTKAAGAWFGIKFGLKIVDKLFLTAADKENLVHMLLKIFIHKRDAFSFSVEIDHPNNHVLDLSWLRLKQETEIVIEEKSQLALDKPNRPCTNEEGYNFPKCVDQFFNQKRGCQPPWRSYPDSDLPPCTNLTAMPALFGPPETGGIDYDYWRIVVDVQALAFMAGCPLPCNTTTYRTHFSYNPGSGSANDWQVVLFYKELSVDRETEFVACDRTCFLGELGGNLGFFLGGSVLAALDILVKPLAKRLAK